MELIRKIESRRGKKGVLVKWGKFYCEFCKNYVERRLIHGKKQKSCGCQQHPKATEELKHKISNSRKGKCLGKNNPNYGNGYKVSGKNNPMYGRKHTEESKNKNSESNKGKQSGINNPMHGIHRFGEWSPNWSGDKSFEPYSFEFNKEKKQSILERDKYTCQNLDCKHKSIELDIHHIDYNKQNNLNENLITLCKSCHSKTNGKKSRQYWTEFYQNIMKRKL